MKVFYWSPYLSHVATITAVVNSAIALRKYSKNMIDISRACTMAALSRTESRGGHTREDHPVPDKGKWSHTTNVIWMENNEIKIKQEDLKQPPEEFEKLLDRSK